MVLKKFIPVAVLLLSSCLTLNYHMPVDVLDKSFANTGTNVVHETSSHNYRLLLPKEATFKEHSAVLSPQLMTLLDKLVRLLKDYPKTSIAVHGYTDGQGDLKLNQALSERRAHAAISYIESQGIKPNRLITHSHGENCPRFFGKEDYLNRRIEISIHYLEGLYEDHCR